MSSQKTNKPGKKIVGAFETVDFPEFGEIGVVAKIDTGAYTGAMHCHKIEEKGEGAEKILTFQPLNDTQEIEKDTFAVKYVRSSNGKREKRYFVTTKITLQDEIYEITLSLTNRSDMKWPVLIGRRFLRQHNFIVDPALLNGYVERAPESEPS